MLKERTNLESPQDAFLLPSDDSAAAELLDETVEETEDAPAVARDGGASAEADTAGVYLNALGRIPLLAREQEVELAKEIESGRLAVRGEIFKLPLAATYVLAICRRLRTGQVDSRTVLEEEQSDQGPSFDERVRRLLKQGDVLEDLVRALARRTSPASRAAAQVAITEHLDSMDLPEGHINAKGTKSVQAGRDRPRPPHSRGGEAAAARAGAPPRRRARRGLGRAGTVVSSLSR